MRCNSMLLFGPRTNIKYYYYNGSPIIKALNYIENKQQGRQQCLKWSNPNITSYISLSHMFRSDVCFSYAVGFLLYHNSTTCRTKLNKNRDTLPMIQINLIHFMLVSDKRATYYRGEDHGTFAKLVARLHGYYLGLT